MHHLLSEIIALQRELVKKQQQFTKGLREKRPSHELTPLFHEIGDLARQITAIRKRLS